MEPRSIASDVPIDCASRDMASMDSCSTLTSFPLSMGDATQPTSGTWLTQHKRKLSDERNEAMRQLIQTWSGLTLSQSPPGCRSILDSKWSTFSTSSDSSKSADEFKASVLWRPEPTPPDFCAPPCERTCLGVQPRKHVVYRGPVKISKRSGKNLGPQKSRNRALLELDEKEKAHTIKFKKEEVKQVASISLLTQSLEKTTNPNLILGPQRSLKPKEVLTRELGFADLSTSMLTSAFESDSEDEA